MGFYQELSCVTLSCLHRWSKQCRILGNGITHAASWDFPGLSSLLNGRFVLREHAGGRLWCCWTWRTSLYSQVTHRWFGLILLGFLKLGSKELCSFMRNLLLKTVHLFWCLSFWAVFQAQRILSPAAVTGYLRQNVSLPCTFIPGPEDDQITQVQWGFKENEGNETIILVSNQEFGIKIHDTFLKDKVGIKEQALIIGGLAERDAGAYTCRISAFPGGSFEASVQLLVEGEHLREPVVRRSDECANNEAIVSCFLKQSSCCGHRPRFPLLSLLSCCCCSWQPLCTSCSSEGVWQLWITQAAYVALDRFTPHHISYINMHDSLSQSNQSLFIDSFTIRISASLVFSPQN